MKRAAPTPHGTRRTLASRQALVVATLAVALALPQARAAPGVVVYRCTAADGAVTLQNDRRCPKGQREERRVLEVPTSRAVPAAAVEPPTGRVTAGGSPSTPARTASAPAAAPGTASRATPVVALETPAPARDATPVIAITPGPAPPVFACRTWDDQRYYGDSERPEPRCAPLQAVGLDRRSATDAQACEMRTDTCEPVLDAARCDAWAERLRVADAGERFGDADSAAAARAEAARLRGILAGTVCAR